MKASVTSEYYDFRYVGTPDYNAAAKLLAYTESRAEAGGRRYAQRIVLKRTDTGEVRSITAGGVSEHSPRLSADGRRLLFLSDVTGVSELYTADIDSGEATRLTGLGQNMSEASWSPDGSRIAFLTTGAAGEPEPPEYVEITDYGYKADEKMGFCEKESTRLWVIKTDGGDPVEFSDGVRDYVMPVWAPDGETLVFGSNRCRPREESIGMDLFSIPKDGGEITRLTDGIWIAFYPARFTPIFTKDGREIIVGAMVPGGDGNMPLTRLYRVPLGGGEAVSLWGGSEICHEATCFFYNCENYGGYYGNAALSGDGQSLYFISGWHGAGNIYKAAVYGEPSITKFTDGEHVFRQLGTVQDGAFIAMKGDFFDTPQVYLIDEQTGAETKLTDTSAWLREKPLSRPTELWIDTLDGDGRVQGWVFPPQNAVPGEKYPAVLYIHGGPTPFFGYGLKYEYQCITGAGIGVIMCNPRGSTGYGARHANMKMAFDGTAMYDLLQFVDEAARACDWIDTERLGVTGGSYGGYMTNWIASHSNKFKAAVTQRSIANEMISYASSDMAGSSKDYESFADFMVDSVKKSPVAYADRINIPFLILHPLLDMRCTVDHAHQLFTAVKDTHPDLPVRMVLFPKSNHELVMIGRMDLRLAHYDETINWLKKYL